ncbi:MAG: LPS export ABC transporter ATP-binding protein [Chlamydiae bacterium RIFCSPLOWO2_01_FULL_28_7]|nr:MAG: LPS export ABC transporter ATP-binding protein [Chlamydiae bacterium RIFCSPLOWO2_01_FULL_28_7]
MNKTLLEVRNLYKSYSSRPIVNGLSFDVKEKEVVGLLGPNGAGKTTAFYITIGLIKADKGEVFFKEKNITDLPIHKRALIGMGYLAQEPSVFRHLTVEENILCILETLNISKEEKTKKVKELLNELNLYHLKDKKAITLSGGERRRVEITRALVRDPDLLLLDEPFANIDPKAVQDVKNLIKHLKQRGIGILITDHNAREIFSIVDRSYIIHEGREILSGSVKELLKNKLAKEHYLGENFCM